MIAAYASQIKANHSFEAKMQSLLEGLKISKSIQFDKVVIEEDAQPFGYPKKQSEMTSNDRSCWELSYSS